MERAWRVAYRRNGEMNFATPHTSDNVEVARAHVQRTVERAEIVTDREEIIPYVRAVEAERNALYVEHVNLTRKVRELRDHYEPDMPGMAHKGGQHVPDDRPDITDIAPMALVEFPLPEDLVDLQVELSDDRKALASQNTELRMEYLKLKNRHEPEMPGHHHG